MLKRLTFCFGLLIFSNGIRAQDFPKPFSFEEVHDVQRTKDQLFDAASNWVIKRFTSSGGSIQLQDKTNGKILAKGVNKVKISGSTFHVEYVLQIEVKDNKYKVSLFNYEHIVTICPNGLPCKNLGSAIDYRLTGKAKAGGSLNEDEPEGITTQGQWKKMKKFSIEEKDTIIRELSSYILSPVSSNNW